MPVDVELLLARNNSAHADNCQRGDIVNARPASTGWGLYEDPRLGHLPLASDYAYVILAITGVPRATIQLVKERYLAPNSDDENTPNEVVVDKRKWQALIDDVPQGMFNKLRDDGFASTTWNKVKAYIRNKRTGEVES